MKWDLEDLDVFDFDFDFLDVHADDSLCAVSDNSTGGIVGA